MNLIKSLVSCAVALSTFPVFAQTAEQSAKSVSVDAHLGMNLSSYYLKPANLRPGILAGVGLNIGKGHFAFNPELNYSMVGANDVMTADWALLHNREVEVRPVATETLHYLEVPLYFKWTFGSKNVRPVIALAPTFALGLSGIRSYVTEDFFMTGDVQNKTPLFKPDTKSPYDDARYNRFDFSAKLKAGVLIKEHYEFLVGFRSGVTSLQREDYESHFSDSIEGTPSWNLFFSLGYRF